jgi:hypothetical protein
MRYKIVMNYPNILYDVIAYIDRRNLKAEVVELGNHL